MHSVLGLSAGEQATSIARGDLSPLELMTATLEQIAARNQELGAIVTLLADQALASARHATEHPPAEPGRLFGLPFTVKDTIEVAGIRCTAGSALLPDYRPPRTAPAVARLQEAGAILVGKTNCPEFGMGALE